MFPSLLLTACIPLTVPESQLKLIPSDMARNARLPTPPEMARNSPLFKDHLDDLVKSEAELNRRFHTMIEELQLLRDSEKNPARKRVLDEHVKRSKVEHIRANENLIEMLGNLWDRVDDPTRKQELDDYLKRKRETLKTLRSASEKDK